MKKSIKIVLCIALALCLLSMLGTAAMQSNWFKASVKTYNVTTAELAGMIRDNNKATGKDIQVTFTEDANANFCFMTMIPKTATAQNPAPAVICIHGGANTKEMQLNGYIELVRRGFVVISMDMAEHGHTYAAINGLTQESYGALAAVEYAMSLPCVDETKIGVTGHSMGNQACYYAIAAMNTEDSTQRIAAWVEGAGSLYSIFMTPEQARNVIWTMSVDLYDEFDTTYFNSATILHEPTAVGIVQTVYPAFAEKEVTPGVFYTPDGVVEAPNNGQKVDADTAFLMLNPPITHPMFHFTKTGTAITVNGFYNGLGTPAGNSYIPAEKQVWPVAVCFELLGLIGFFMLLFPLVAILADKKAFAGIKRALPEKESLPSAKSPAEIVAWVVTAVLSVWFAFVTYIKYYPLANNVLDPSVYAVNDVPNGIGFWSVLCGVFAVVMILLGWLIKKIFNRKAEIKPFANAGLDSLSQFFLTVLYALCVVALMYVPVIIARYVFNADFRICSFVVAWPPLEKLPIIIVKYLPLWLAFYIPNALANANTRYRDLPDWVSALACAVVNGIALVIFLFIQYGTLFRTGALWNSTAAMAGIVAFAVVPCLFYAAFSARYIYKKTGNIWAAGLINGAVMCFATTFATRYMTDFIINF
ncbi:MAG: hypothetical protein IK149_03455 [Oscillospiraceae bacterium]|nr:hypothetical protein [Oscillospiraceae bacterium]